MNKKEFARRRAQLMDIMGPDSIAVLPNAQVATRNRDVDYVYRSDSNFHYLSGFDEPESVVVIMPGRPHGEYLLFCRERDMDKEIWDGYRAGQEGAIEQFGADDSYPISDLDDILPGLLEGREKVYYTMGNIPSFDQISGNEMLRGCSAKNPRSCDCIERCSNGATGNRGQGLRFLRGDTTGNRSDARCCSD
jgi:Xaa-Pro aminopeptidase